MQRMQRPCLGVQALEFAIERGLERVEAGAQGEHKLSRGYLPALTYSLHDLPDQRFSGVVERCACLLDAMPERQMLVVRWRWPGCRPTNFTIVSICPPCRFLYQEREQMDYTMEMLAQEMSPYKQV